MLDSLDSDIFHSAMSMEFYTSMVLLVYITCVTVAALEQPTTHLTSKDLIGASPKRLLRTSIRTSATNEERMNPPVVDDLLALKLGRNSMADSLKLGENNVNKDPAAVKRLEEHEKSNVNKESTAFYEGTSNKALQLQLPDHTTPSVFYFQDPNGITAVEDLINTAKVRMFYEKVASVHNGKVTPEMLVVILGKHFKSTPLAESIEFVCHCGPPPARQRGIEWQKAQLYLWFQRREPVMSNLGFNRDATHLSNAWNMKVLKKYVSYYNEWTGGHKTMASFFSDYYGQENLVKILVNAQNSNVGKIWAIRIQNELLEQWKTTGLQPDKVLAHLNAEDTIKLLRTSDLDLVIAQYPVGEEKRLWIDILKQYYDEKSVIAELLRLKSQNKVAAALLEQKTTDSITADRTVHKTDEFNSKKRKRIF